MQLVRPGAPLIYAVLSTMADMRTGNYTPGPAGGAGDPRPG
ncbi:MAG: hypothetical protein U1C55_05415 [Smithellaceae bacterium]|nr:hypothetical protein [Smithellaceae bacterium]